MPDAALEIANLKARYCAAADLFPGDPGKARHDLLACLTEDFTGEYGVARFASPDQIAVFFATAIGGGSDWMVHHLTSPNIVITGDQARGDWAVLVHSKRRNGERMEVTGRYADCFRRTSDGWKIAAITFTQYK